MTRKMIYILSVFMAVCLFMCLDLEGRGRGGRGGRGGGRIGGAGRISHGRAGGGRVGGQAKVGRSTRRSPSLSRSTRSRASARYARPSRPQITTPHTRPARRPTTARPATRPQRPSGGRTPTRNQVQQFLKDRPPTRPAARPGQRPGQRPGDGPIGRPGDRLPDRPGRQPGGRQEIGNQIRDKIGQQRPDRSDWFDGNFWDEHRHRPSYYDRHDNWWKWATVGGVAGWLNWRRNPVYYGGDYGGGSYWGPYDYYTGETVDYSQPTQDYSQQAEHLEAAADQPTSNEWMPLGVFALSKESGTTATPNLYLQLALNKDGLLSGTYYNTTTDQTYEAEGVVDNQSQLAAWKIVDSDSSPILETGIYNLTQDETPVRVNFEDGRTQEMLLVRLEK